MTRRSFVTASAILAALALGAAPAAAQSRGRAVHRAGAVHRGGGIVTRHAVPRVGIAPRIIRPRVIGIVPYRPYSYRYHPGLRLGIYAGFGYPYGYRYPYRYYGSYSYGYPYSYYGSFTYGYPYSYPYGYGYAYPAYYPPPPASYLSAVPGRAYGGVRIDSPNPDAQVFVDGYYVGIVDDFDGTFQHLNLEAGPHHIEIRTPNAPSIEFDVNVQPGQTITFRADIR